MQRGNRLPTSNFVVEATEGAARAARFETAHGPVETPVFMPVATRASLKALSHDQLLELDPGVLLANAYHLHLRPGESIVRDLGGLHGFTGWQRPWLTDSGGYQAFSLGRLVRVDEEGATFQSHLDGRAVRLGPREAMAIQEALGADIIMAFDHCLGLPQPRAAIEAAVERTTRWTRTAAAAQTRDDQFLFGIVQGGTDLELREQSARALVDLDLPGYAIGGLAVGEGTLALRETTRHTAALLPPDRPRYLMGVGQPLDLLDAVGAGIDMFDCVVPTRNGRRGWLLTRDGTLRIGSREHARDESTVDPTCRCLACRTHSRAYMRHLFHVNEHVAATLGSLHNLTFLVDLMREARRALLDGRFAAWRQDFIVRYAAGEAERDRRLAADPEGARRSQAARREDDAPAQPEVI